jgi:hypothetical protein
MRGIAFAAHSVGNSMTIISTKMSVIKAHGQAADKP